MITVPDEARRRLEVRFGPGVGAWVDRAPALVDTLVRRWGLVLDGTVLHGNSALVLPADRGVLKLHPDEVIAAAEAAALAHWAPAGHVVDLLEYHDDAAEHADRGALLLARVRPGDALADTLATDPAVLPALRELWSTPGVVAGLESATERMTFGLSLVRARAGPVAERLGADVLDHAWCRALAPANAVAALRAAPDAERTRALVALARAGP